MKFIAYLSIFFVSFSIFSQAKNSELEKIDALLEAIRTSDVVFIRNGDEHNSLDAYKHLKRKLKSVQRSWFTPPKEKWTAELFIEKIASKSSLSGKAYLVRLKNGEIIEAKTWLTNHLKKISKD